jgi:hypothetical protein
VKSQNKINLKNDVKEKKWQSKEYELNLIGKKPKKGEIVKQNQFKK